MPTTMTPTKVTKLTNALRAWIAKNADLLGSTRVWSADEWKARNEKYCNGALLVVTTEDSLYEGLNYGGLEAMFAEQFHELLKKHGCYEEPAHAWMRGVYPE